MTAVLSRYSKPRGAGDQTSGGRGKLLRAHGSLTRAQILVRETLQNSWDAARPGKRPSYEARVRRLEDDAVVALTENVFTGLGPELDALVESLASSDLHVIEISDRGTTGLNGPISPDRAVEEGEPNNFNAFVFDIGSSKPLGSSGGTFGFGKNSTFEVSSPHAVVYWTRCDRGDGVLEDRLIASALHDPYDEDGLRFTGAHWWGDTASGDVLPLVGQPATELAQVLFQRHFDAGDCGTSILVVDPMVTIPDSEGIGRRTPVRDFAAAEKLCSQLVETLLTSAWPKFVAEDSGQTPMDITLMLYDEPVDVAGKVAALYRVHGHGLARIRRAQAGIDEGEGLVRPGEVVETDLQAISLRPSYTDETPRKSYFGDRSDTVSGHIFLAKALRIPPAPGLLDSWRVNSGCFMRSSAELVVMYEPMVDENDGTFMWVAVFKPTPECDRHFAAAEPATHDDWNKNAPDSLASAYVVDKTLGHVRHRMRKFMLGDRVKSVTEERSTRQLAQSLSGFVPVGGPPPTSGGTASASRAGNGGSSSSAAGVAGEVAILNTIQDAHGTWHLAFRTPGSAGERRRLRASVRAATTEGAFGLTEDEVKLSWDAGDGTEIGGSVVVRGGVEGVLHVGMAIEATIMVDIDAEEVA
ncbi:hypothetical protein [Micrococcus luteus]|uniref:hypothetical protein n=1 Tax=Micrococcus luteus TaxID=1270 RepID=UPI00343A2FAE